MSLASIQRVGQTICKLNVGECAKLADCRRDEIDLAMRRDELRFYRVAGERYVDPPDLRAWILTRSGGRQHGK